MSFLTGVSYFTPKYVELKRAPTYNLVFGAHFVGRFEKVEVCFFRVGRDETSCSSGFTP